MSIPALLTCASLLAVVSCSPPRTGPTAGGQEPSVEMERGVRQGRVGVRSRGQGYAGRDTLVLLRQPYTTRISSYPPDPAFAASKQWFLSGAEIRLRGQTYVKFGPLYSLQSTSGHTQGVRVLWTGEHDAVPVFGGPTTSRPQNSSSCW